MMTAIALAAYGGLIALALIVASWWDINLWGNVTWTTDALRDNLIAAGYGTIAALPLLVCLVIFDRWTPWILVPLKRSVEQEVVPLLMYSSIGDYLLISIAAGVGEELFFRGLVQAGLTRELLQFDVPNAIWISIVAASLIFGACHWINHEYALIAAIIGVYFGLLYHFTGNLIAPITAHAFYDFIAMVYLVVLKGKQRKWPGAP
jgi:membrane protease YdiL (CAAX protease family)